MRKVVKPALKCKLCGQITEHEKFEEFCDQCQKLMTEETYPLHMTVFVKGADETYDVNVCSWECLKRYFIENKKKLLQTEFISLPYPTFDTKVGKQYVESGREFFKVFIGESK